MGAGENLSLDVFTTKVLVQVLQVRYSMSSEYFAPPVPRYVHDKKHSG